MPSFLYLPVTHVRRLRCHLRTGHLFVIPYRERTGTTPQEGETLGLFTSMYYGSQKILYPRQPPNGICRLAKTLCELTEDNQALIALTKNHLEEISNELTALIQ